MRFPGRPVPPTAIVVAALVCFLTTVAVAGQPGRPRPPAAAPGVSHGDSLRTTPEPEAARPAPANPATPASPAMPVAPVVPVRPLSASAAWSGYAFDACRAPSQRVMDRWRTASPFTGVGIYLGGIHRACDQQHLTRAWVSRQLRSGWKLLSIWVGPQASCTGYDHRIPRRPGRARAAGQRQARQAVAAARALRVPAGETLFYDLEPFSTRHAGCRRSSLAFLEEWTREIRRHGYRSGVYGAVGSGISLLSRASATYVRPDAVWYAWIDRVGDMPRRYVRNTAFMRTSRVHQYALDQAVEFGGIRMRIDWNFVSLGAVRPLPPATCDQVADRLRPLPVSAGSRGLAVRAVQCLVAGWHPAKSSGRYDAATVRQVRLYQRRHGLGVTGTVDRRTWTSLLASGHAPVLRKGARGEPVRRLQRSLNAAVGRPVVRVDGAYGKATARAVRAYRVRLGLGNKPVAGARVWHALERGRVL
ncbi:MAG: DUF1906 domain-containing protein [Nocardioidaceae bacterium]|nr:DUF1906 domain-containing protein [Nocardioidaceae bacterium]